ncbi:MAG: hypothetical protein ACYDCN_15290 [Bacteroidia bacterium]
MNICKLYILISLYITSLNCNGQSPFAGGGWTGNVGVGNNFFIYSFWGVTGVFSAINGTTTYFNIKKLNTPDKYKENAIVGTVSGIVQTAFGFLCTADKSLYVQAPINIGFGLTTVVTSIIRLANKRPPKDEKITFNFFYLPPVEHHTATCGIRIVGRLN